MAISKVVMEDFLIFKEEFVVDFCPGVNVLIGGNGSGKTTLIKAIYAVCRYPYTVENSYDSIRTPYIQEYFSVLNDSIDKHNNINSGYKYNLNLKKCKVTVDSYDISWEDDSNDIEKEMKDEGSNSSLSVTPSRFYNTSLPSEFPSINTVYIPTMEMLSHSNGLIGLYDKYKLPFDRTQIDVLRSAELPELRKISPLMQSVIDKIERIIGGEVISKNGMFFIQKKTGEMTPYSFEAEGFKRFGLLWRLIKNGTIESGCTLFWDEPESSINPELISDLVDILLELQRNGIQIFVATHSYDIARWFELNATNGDNLKYFNLKRTNKGVECTATAYNYKSLEDSVIEDASDKLYNAVMFKINGEHKNG